MQSKLKVGAAIAAVLFVSLSAQANLTTVHAPPVGEASQAEIMSHIYGGTFTGLGFNSPSYTNGSITATRIDDTTLAGGIGNNLHLVFGTPGLPTTDQRWNDGIAVTSAEAKFAAYSQKFGYNDGSGYTNLFDVGITGPSGYDVSGNASHQFASGTPWEWMRNGQGGLYSSTDANNSDGIDHMVTYAVSGLPGVGQNEAVWLVFWEDLNGPFASGKSDRDFNDLVVEIDASVSSTINPVPVPGAFLLGCVGLGFAALVRKRSEN